MVRHWEHFLDQKIFADMESETVEPDAKDIEGFETFLVPLQRQYRDHEDGSGDAEGLNAGKLAVMKG